MRISTLLALTLLLTGVYQERASAQIPDKDTRLRFDKKREDPDLPDPNVFERRVENQIRTSRPIRIEHLPDFHHYAMNKGPKSAANCSIHGSQWRCGEVKWNDRRTIQPGRTYLAVVPGTIPLKGPTSDAIWAPKVTCRLWAGGTKPQFESAPGVTCMTRPEYYGDMMDWGVGGEAYGIDGDVQGVYHGQIPVTVEGPDGRWTAIVPIEYTVGVRINECSVSGAGSLDFGEVEQGESEPRPVTAKGPVKITIEGGDQEPHVDVSSPVDEWSHEGNSPVTGPGFELDSDGPTKEGSRWIYKMGGTISVPSTLALGDYEATVTVSVTCRYN